MRPPEVDIDLTPDQQRRIETVFGQLRAVNLYELLGVARTADKKAVKRAYNEHLMEFHPDRFFRKRLGSFKIKMEAIVMRMTEAHDVLCSPEHRDRYDVVLRSNRASLVDAMLEGVVNELQVGSASGEQIASAKPVEVQSAPPPSSRSGAHQSPSRSDLQARREALAARLGSGRRTPAAPFRPMSVPVQEARPTELPLAPAPIGGAIANLRTLHAKHKRQNLHGAERALYDSMREDFAHTFVAAQRLSLQVGQTYRQALRVACTLKVEVSCAGRVHRTVTLDLSSGGLGALVGESFLTNTPCDFILVLEPEPIRGQGRVVACVRHGASAMFRLSLSFDALPEPSRERLETIVLDHALGALKT
jgi:curved DNA-binding protein CbpA